MKQTRILQTVILGGFVLLLASCGVSRQYVATPYPPPPVETSFSLVIGGYPGLAVNRYPDGRYYYRNPQGYIYWRGADNRYYLDRTYLNRVHYNQHQYHDWNRGYGRGRNRR